MKRLTALLSLLLSVSFAGCGAIDEITVGLANAESFRFQYVFAEAIQATPSSEPTYHLPPASSQDCNTFYTLLDGRPLSIYLPIIQGQGISTSPWATCAPYFEIGVEDARRIREEGLLLFNLDRTGQNGLLFTVERDATSANTDPNPIAVVIDAIEGQTEDQPSSLGTMTFGFGMTGPQFTCSGGPGDLPWVLNGQDTGSDTFFEFESEVFENDPDRAGGRFQCIARNSADPSDTRLLLIMHGDFTMQF